MDTTTDMPPAGSNAHRWWTAGARAEANCRTEGRAPAALEVAAMVDAFGQDPLLRDRDAAHFAGLAAEIYYAGQPLARRLRAAWRILRT